MSSRNGSLKYTNVPYDEIAVIVKLFYERFKHFLSEKGYPADLTFHVSTFDLVDMISRVDKRKAYYQCFHGMTANECKVAALYAYWVLKLKPFTITDNRFNNQPTSCNINEAFAIYIIGAALCLTNRVKLTKATKGTYYNLLEYSFRFRNISIDSFIVLVESIATETCERDYPNLGYGIPD
jgi:hypothetical protein